MGETRAVFPPPGEVNVETRIGDIILIKGSNVVAIERGATVYDALRKLTTANVGSVLVTANGGVCGIFTERDVVRRVALEGRNAWETPVEEVMTRQVISVSVENTLEEAMGLMTFHRCRHLPVTRGGKLVGVVSIGDCVKHISRRAVAQSEELTHYIVGTYPR